MARSQADRLRHLFEPHSADEARQCASNRIGGCKHAFHYSTFAPESLTAFVHLASSVLTNPPSSSGLICIGSTPCAKNCSLMSLLLSALLTSALSFATIGPGVLAGAMIATHGT